jgi:hypothetical protein
VFSNRLEDLLKETMQRFLCERRTMTATLHHPGLSSSTLVPYYASPSHDYGR